MLAGIVWIWCRDFIGRGIFCFADRTWNHFQICTSDKTGTFLWLYEMAAAAGGIFGTAWYLYSWKIPAGLLGLGIYGVCAGIFVGAWTMALTEIIDTIPIFMRRIYLKKGLTMIVWSLAIGHTAGSLLHVFLWG